MKAVLRGESPDRPCWTTLVDGPTLDALPGEWKGLDAISFYRKLGCDILQLGGWGTPFDFSSPAFTWGEGVSVEEVGEGDRTVRRWTSRAGVLAGVIHESGHPVKYPVETREELAVYLRMWEGAAYGKRDDQAAFVGVGKMVGENGIVARMWGPSTIPRLLEYEMGTENFYSLLDEHRDRMEALFSLMHEKEMEAFGALAGGPCETVILTENTSTFYISPEVYRKYNRPHVRDFVDAMHSAGKTAIIHMCGHINRILPLIKETALDGVHTLTPPPTGDTPYETAFDVLGEDKVIIGALDPTVFVSGPPERIPETLDAIYTERLRRLPFVLCPFADGIPVPVERFLSVAEWMGRNGGLV